MEADEVKQTYIVDLSIGGTMRVKVDAENEDAAMLVAQAYFIEDWENAGPLKYSDVHVDAIHDGASSDIDASIVATGDVTYDYAADDPHGRGEEIDAELPAVPAG